MNARMKNLAQALLASGLVGWALAASAAADRGQHPLMSPAQFQSLPSKPADHRIAYGTDPSQYVELRVPSTPGPRIR